MKNMVDQLASGSLMGPNKRTRILNRQSAVRDKKCAEPVVTGERQDIGH